jgi:hypothetical protein
MTIRDKGYPSDSPAKDRLRRKANQEWNMARLARQNRDNNATMKHTTRALDYERRLGEIVYFAQCDLESKIDYQLSVVIQKESELLQAQEKLTRILFKEKLGEGK